MLRFAKPKRNVDECNVLGRHIGINLREPTAMTKVHEGWPRPTSAVGGSVPGSQVFLYCNPCLGIPPIAIASPERYVAIQVLVGLGCLLALYVFEGHPF